MSFSTDPRNPFAAAVQAATGPGAGPAQCPAPNPIHGPVVRIDSWLPCGCSIGRQGPTELLMFFCPAHDAAYEIRDALESSLVALRDILQHGASSGHDLGLAMEAAMKARVVIRKVSRSVWSR